MFKPDVFAGNREVFNEKLRTLSEMAEPEKWTFARIRESDPYRVLRNYIQFTYNRLEDEKKLSVSNDGKNMCMNTGLLTVYHQEIVALFSKYSGSFDYKWFLVGFFKASDSRITSLFSSVPRIADFTQDISDLVYDRNLEIVVQKNHIIDDNLVRFENAGYYDRELISVLLDAAVKTVRLKLERNYKLALPFYYHNSETGENKIQLLAPLYMPGAPVKLALVLDRKDLDVGSHYECITVLPVDWAYMNSRVIVKPEEEWARIVDEFDSEDGDDNEIDKEKT